MSEEPDLEAVAALIEDETARRILTEISSQPMSASDLSERCDASKPTVYRRLDDLRQCDLLEETTKPDPSGGHHHTLYATNLDRIVVEVGDGSLRLEIDRRETMADRFTRLVEGM